MQTIAFILARKNSKRVKNKNHLMLKKFNLAENTVNFAKKLNFIKRVVLTTNDKSLLNYNYKYSLIKIKRPENLSKSNSKSVSALIHAFDVLKRKKIKFENILLLQPTSPFRSKKMLQLGYNIFKKNIFIYSVISVSKSSNQYKKKFEIRKKKLILSKKNKNKNFQVNGNFYFASKSFILKNKSFFKNNFTLAFKINSEKYSIDIDTIHDYKKTLNFLT